MALENGMSNLDMTGKLIIKASLGDDIRRIPIHNDDLTYDELVLMMQRVFRGVLNPEEELLLKYKDEDGDLITIIDNSDLSFAIQYCRVLRLTIIVGADDRKKDVAVGNDIAKELREIRDKVNKLLDTVTDSSKSQGPSDDKGDELTEGVSAEEAVSQAGQINQVENREFDPLGQEQIQQESPASTAISGDAATAFQSSQQSSDTASFPAAAGGYQAPDLSSFTPTAASSAPGYQQYTAPSSTAPPSGGYAATTASSAGYQAPPSLAPPTSAYQGAPPTLAPPSTGYQVTTASQVPPPSGFPTTTSAHAPPANSFTPQASGYQASTSASLPPSTPSYPSASYPTQPPPNANFPRPSSTPSTVPPTSYAYPSPQPHYSPYHPPNYPSSPAGYPTQPPNPYSRGPPTSQQGYQHPGMGGQQQQ